MPIECYIFLAISLWGIKQGTCLGYGEDTRHDIQEGVGMRDTCLGYETGKDTQYDIPDGVPVRDGPPLHLHHCGIKPMSRIVGGEVATPHSWPWQAEILLRNGESGQLKFKCGGTLITPLYVVTAAHCVFAIPFPESYEIRLGVHDRRVSDQVQRISVSEIHINKEAMTKGYGNDIALIKLSRPAILGRSVGLACLPSGNDRDRVPPGTKCFMTGWGSSYFQGKKSQILMQAEMPIVDHKTCAKGNEKLGEVVDRMMICAGYGGDSSISGCHGDSGGPLVCQDKKSGHWTLRGTVSWGDHYCNGGPTYSVFVRINSYVDWIKCKMNSQPLQPIKGCVDTHFYCDIWGRNFCEYSYFANMLKTFYCKKMCNAC